MRKDGDHGPTGDDGPPSMTRAEMAARATIARLYRETPPEVARARLQEAYARHAADPSPRWAIGMHGPLGFYASPKSMVESYADHLQEEGCLQCLANRTHFAELAVVGGSVPWSDRPAQTTELGGDEMVGE